MKKAFSRPGKIMEIEKKAKIMEFQNTSMEKSWKIFLSCTGIIPKKFVLRVHIPIGNWCCFIFCGEGDVEATVRKVK